VDKHHEHYEHYRQHYEHYEKRLCGYVGRDYSANNGHCAGVSGVGYESVSEWTEKWTVSSFRTGRSGIDTEEELERGDQVI